MNSWETIRYYFTKDFNPGTFGYIQAMYKAGGLFILLLPWLNDEKTALDSFDSDPVLKEAILISPQIKEMIKEGILSP